MDIFAIEKGKAYVLNIDNYEEITKKRFPFYQYGPDKKIKYYAICPECGNPIQIVNLYGAEMMQNKTRLIKTYAKHTNKKINGFNFWNEKNKKECSLFSPVLLGNTTIKHDKEYIEELRSFIENNKDKILSDIKEIVGINLSEKLLNNLYDVFVESKSYVYKAVTKYNIPYAITYYQSAVSLYGQYIRKCALGDIIIEKINKESNYFIVNDNRKIIKKVSEYVSINLIFTHFRNNGNKPSIIMEINETIGEKNHNTIFKEILEVKSYTYS